MSDRIAVMSGGHYEQLGDPESLYERPATRFVAGFLGVSNLLPVTSDGIADGHAVLRRPDGTALRAPRASAAGHGDRISIGVRPEKIRIHERTAEPPASANTLDGVIRTAAYLGVSTQYVVELLDGQAVTVYEQNVERATHAELWSKGEEVRLSWSPDHSFIVADDASAAAAVEELQVV